MTDSKPRTIKFRNYKPHDSALINNCKEELQECKTSNATTEEDVLTHELAAAQQDTEVHLIPRKANWDLKSQCSSNLGKLKRKTQRAIVDILRDKMQELAEVDGDVA